MYLADAHNGENTMNKKADLNLSINAIVVLILAITMLGLGLGFMRNVLYPQPLGDCLQYDYRYCPESHNANRTGVFNREAFDGGRVTECCSYQDTNESTLHCQLEWREEIPYVVRDRTFQECRAMNGEWNRND